MGEMEFLQSIMRHVDLVGVAFAIMTVSLLKAWLLPETKPGSTVSRLVPFFPVVAATLFVFIMGFGSPWRDLVAKGVATGAVAGYGYRMWKVTVLGG